MSKQAQISVLEFPDNVRLRRGMYLPSKDHAVSEIVDNGVDEGAAGYADTIIVTINQDQVVNVCDNGRGIPVTPHKDPKYKGLTQAEVAYTVLHAGGKFGTEDGYKTITGGLNGVGASVVNALSEWLELEVYCDNKIHKCRFEKGHIVEHMREIGTYDEDISGTSVTFKLDEPIWEGEQFDLKHIVNRLRQLSYLNPKLTFVANVDSTDKDGKPFKCEETFHHPTGLTAYIERLTKARTCLTPIFSATTTVDDMEITYSFVYTDAYNEDTRSFVNNINTDDGGDHLIGLRHGISGALNNYATENKINNKFEISDALEGVCGIISIKVKDPHFDGQSKAKIKMPWIRGAIREFVTSTVYATLDANPDVAKIIVDKALLAQKVRNQAAKVRDAIRKSKSLVEGKPEKFADCQSKDPKESEIWIAEGDSAGGSLKSARDRRTQAILPIFGKILNVKKSNLADVLKNPKLLDLLKALKCGIAEEFDIEKLRYHKIILASDADVDGAHIATLFITFFYLYLREIIEAGYLYISLPPLYKIEQGKTKVYAYSDEEKDQIVASLTGNYNVQRYKGLGEMMPEQLWETTMNPEVRTLIQVTVEDAEAALEILDICMGEKVEPRKNFIVENALIANLDI